MIESNKARIKILMIPEKVFKAVFGSMDGALAPKARMVSLHGPGIPHGSTIHEIEFHDNVERDGPSGGKLVRYVALTVESQTYELIDLRGGPPIEFLCANVSCPGGVEGFGGSVDAFKVAKRLSLVLEDVYALVRENAYGFVRDVFPEVIRERLRDALNKANEAGLTGRVDE